MKDIFKSTPNLNNKDGATGAAGCKKSPTSIAPLAPSHMMNVAGHTRSTSYSVSYCTRKASNSPIEKQGKWVYPIWKLYTKNKEHSIFIMDMEFVNELCL